MNRILSIAGGALTAAYLWFGYHLFGDRLASVKQMPLNEVGDFLAGVFGPIAILWLILGFFRQGVELRQNSNALRQQAEELAHSVEQQKQLVEVSRQQVAAELDTIAFERDRTRRAALPVLVPQGVGASFSDGNANYTAHFINVGSTCTSVLFLFDPAMKKAEPDQVPTWQRGESITLHFAYHTPGAESGARLVVKFLDAAAQPGELVFTLVPVENASGPLVKIMPHEG
jgi:hypothetical protein